PPAESPENVEPVIERLPELMMPPPDPTVAELFENDEPAIVSWPEFMMAPAELAELPLIVELATDSVPALSIAPAWDVAVLFLIVELTTEIVEFASLEIAPPPEVAVLPVTTSSASMSVPALSTAPPWAALPPVIVMLLSVTCTLGATLNNCV